MSIAAVIQLWHVLCQVTLNSRFCCYTDWLNAGWKFSAVYIIWFVASSCFRVMEHVELRGHSRASTVFFFSNCCSSAIYPQRLLHICSASHTVRLFTDFVSAKVRCQFFKTLGIQFGSSFTPCCQNIFSSYWSPSSTILLQPAPPPAPGEEALPPHSQLSPLLQQSWRVSNHMWKWQSWLFTYNQMKSKM